MRQVIHAGPHTESVPAGGGDDSDIGPMPFPSPPAGYYWLLGTSIGYEIRNVSGVSEYSGIETTLYRHYVLNNANRNIDDIIAKDFYAGPLPTPSISQFTGAFALPQQVTIFPGERPTLWLDVVTTFAETLIGRGSMEVDQLPLGQQRG